MNPLNYPTDPIIPMIIMSVVVWSVLFAGFYMWWIGGMDDD